ncbi:hypothetical protein G5I_07234 [Acromyrmex echinatior]|uniref:Uncharacterized protein n=1 Tax=Acromyrmex echinatior TaxID=103372 RepID=F4WN84_ACREC|nr:hypothetical protein G5I_07234 [Acromyrmex echinatior]
MAIQPAQACRKRDSRGPDRGNNQVEEEGRGLKAALGSNDSSQNNPAYKLDCWWDMETERGQGRENRRDYMCNSETGNTVDGDLHRVGLTRVDLEAGVLGDSLSWSGGDDADVNASCRVPTYMSGQTSTGNRESGGKRKVEISGSLDLQSPTIQRIRSIWLFIPTAYLDISCELSDVPLRSFAAAPNSTTEMAGEKGFYRNAHWSHAVRPSTMKRNPANGFLFVFAKVSAFGFRIKTILSTRDPVIFTSPQAPWKESAEGEGKISERALYQALDPAVSTPPTGPVASYFGPMRRVRRDVPTAMPYLSKN